MTGFAIDGEVEDYQVSVDGPALGTGVFGDRQHNQQHDHDGASSVDTNDIDGDGDLDVVSATFGGQIAWYENDGSGNFTTTVIGSGASGGEVCLVAGPGQRR